jgi:putative SOS response-associated peptidase YedK
MCGRFTLDIPSELLVEIFGLAEHPTISPRYNIAPTQQIPIIRQYADGQNYLDHIRWGLIPSWFKDKPTSNLMINARSETVSEKPAFKQSVRYRRCVIPSSGFYEWKSGENSNTPWHIRLKDGSPMVFAGLYDTWKSQNGEVVESCTGVMKISVNTVLFYP